MGDSAKRPAEWGGYASKGFELVAAILGFALVGYWLGGKYGDQLLGTAIGAVLGIVGGMYNLIRLSLAASRRAQATRENSDQ
ncbi:MAG: AtpZ/AtpI family protein [Acidobacteria bacterium]|nr:AtpZ/AtpI family protein [Acidobacteriota bacterium]